MKSKEKYKARYKEAQAQIAELEAKLASRDEKVRELKERLKQAKLDASSRDFGKVSSKMSSKVSSKASSKASSRVSSVSSRRSSVARQSPERRAFSRESSDESELSARYNSQVSRTSSRAPRTTRSFELARARNEARVKNQFYDSATSVESAGSRKRQRSPAKSLKESRKRDMEDINRNIQALTQLLQAIQK